MYVKFCDCEVSVAGNERISVGIRSKFNMLINHRFAQIDLPSIESNVSPAIDFNDVISSALLVFCNLIAVRSFAGDV